MVSLAFVVLISTGSLLFVAASLFLLFDHIRWRQKQQERETALWYQRPRPSLGIVGLWLSLFVCFIAFWNLNTYLPALIYQMGLLSIYLVLSCGTLISTMRNVHRQHSAGGSLDWYQHPQPLKQMARVAFLSGTLFLESSMAYSLSQGFPYSSYRVNMIFLLFPSFFLALGLVLYIYAFIRQMCEVYKGIRSKKSSDK